MSILFWASCCGLVVTGLDLSSLFEEELQYIWKPPPRITLVKVLYLFSRYFALLAQITNCIITGVWLSKYSPIPPSLCRPWIIYQTVVTYFLLGAVNIILILRVYALYNRNNTLLLVVLSIFVGKVGVNVYTAFICIPKSPLHFDSHCLITHGAGISPYFVGAEIFCQCVLLLFVYAKRFSGWRSGLKSVPVLSIILLDGSLVFILTAALLVVTLALAFKSGAIALFVYPAFVCLLSAAGCRLIINIRRLAEWERTPTIQGELSTDWDVSTGFCTATSTTAAATTITERTEF